MRPPCQRAHLTIKLTSHIQKVATPPPTPRTRKRNLVTPVTPTRRSARRQPPEDYKPYVTPSNIAQLRFKQAKKNTSGIANPHTPRAGVSPNPFETCWNSPLSIFSSRLKTSRMASGSDNLQRPMEKILNSSFHRPPFDSTPPMAMNSDHYNMSETYHHQRDTFQIQRQDHLYNDNRSIPYRHHHHHPHHQRDTPEIPLQDMYLAPPLQVSKFSFLSALNLAREKKKWLLINIQSATVPECGILNQEIWGDPDIAEIVSQSFVFLQLNHNDERAEAYFGKYYGFLYLDEKSEGMLRAGNNRKIIIQLPHIALLDPVSGYRWKVWEGPRLPDKDRFLADISEFEMVGEGDWCERGKGVIRERD